MKLGVFQGQLELQGFSAPRCPGCHATLDTVTRVSTPYLLETHYEWDKDAATWREAEKRLEADPSRKPIERYHCGACGKPLPRRLRDLFFGGRAEAPSEDSEGVTE